ncbi:MAG: SDR family oxidoreductase [Candidatus Omnitrophica bacterium]|nr:SDR family oxidoreductase [Candidatus Omnitrophota bacterium]MDE2222080.1 SDR family oxidoreductase [Candidatus Omnitrophota bacterium]
MKKFLITGGAGFIGSHIARFLTKQGYFVRVLDNFHTGRPENLDFAAEYGKDLFQLICGDITSMPDCLRACEGVDVVIHQAAMLSVPESLKDPLSYNQVNINGTLMLLQAAVHCQVKRFVFASSAAVYGDTDDFPLRETHCPRPISPYGLSKLAGEYYCRIFSSHFGLETICLRYFNVFGPGQRANDEYAGVIPKFIRCLLNDEPAPIFGNGQQSRDFVYVDNVVAANVASALTTGLSHQIFNVASGKVITILQLAGLLNSILSKDISPRFLPYRSGDIFKIDADVSRIKQAIHYKPSVTLEEGLKETVNYFQKTGGHLCQLGESSAVV